MQKILDTALVVALLGISLTVCLGLADGRSMWGWIVAYWGVLVVRNVVACWRPNENMPKEACRLFLRVTDVRVERVQDITDADARAEGCGESDVVYYNGALKCMFFELWDSINAKRGFGWEKNPWVWVYTYERVDKPEGWCA